ncbi:MAG: leucyl aminopeptidase [Acidimicrobiales bacterium]|nr:leucyl aminopeptidase [Acidimicrobiales bacterium]
MTTTFSVPKFSTARRFPARSEVVAHGITTAWLDGDSALPSGLDRADLLRLGFTAKAGQIQIVPVDGRLLAAVGLGDLESLSNDSLRQTAAALSRAVRGQRSLATDLASVVAAAAGPAEVEGVAAVVEGLSLALYRFGYQSTESSVHSDKLTRIVLVGSTSANTRAAVERAVAVTRGVTLARDLVNEPGGSLTPPKFANRVRRMARDRGLTFKVMDEAAIRRARMGGLLGVNRGSTQPPRFVELTYTPEGRSKGTLALVGKGLTFDAGGLSIKSGQGMMDMKMDMGGAAAVVGAMSVLPSVAPQCKVRAYLPMTDNMLGGDATRPGDVLTIRNGKTIEVLNTDAEGRLILADALSVASEAKPDAVVDLATLTGACMVALGPSIAGLMGRGDGFLQQVEASSSRTGERVWRLPLPDDYRCMIESPVADMKNIGGSYGGAITAGLLLGEFVAEGIDWAHLDIAGPAFTDSDEAEVVRGGTGFGVRLLVDLATSFAV